MKSASTVSLLIEQSAPLSLTHTRTHTLSSLRHTRTHISLTTFLITQHPSLSFFLRLIRRYMRKMLRRFARECVCIREKETVCQRMRKRLVKRQREDAVVNKLAVEVLTAQSVKNFESKFFSFLRTAGDAQIKNSGLTTFTKTQHNSTIDPT